MKKIILYALAFYATAPVLGCYVAVAITLWTSWTTGNPFLGLASLLVGACLTALCAGVAWLVRS